MKLETLYKRDKSGKKVLVYNVQVIQDSFYASIIFKDSGEMGGKTKRHEEVITKGKQKRTVYEQACSQAQSAWNKKRDEGYKSLADLDIIENGNSKTYYQKWETTMNLSLGEILLKHLPTERTDASGNLKPMKCTATNDTKSGGLLEKVMKKIQYPAVGQPKLDGVRGFIFCDETGWRATSSSGKSYDVMARKVLQEIAELDLPQDIILDGEFYIHGTPLQILSGWARKQTPIIEHESMEFHVFDMPSSKSWIQRREELNILFDNVISINSRIKKVVDFILMSQEEVIGLHDTFVAQGYEGIIIRNHKGSYEYGCRSNHIFKMKAFQDAEFKVIGAELGQRGAFDMVFSCETVNGKIFEAKPLGNEATKNQYWNDLDNIVGKMATVRFLTYSVDGIPQGNTILKAIRDYE